MHLLQLHIKTHGPLHCMGPRQYQLLPMFMVTVVSHWCQTTMHLCRRAGRPQFDTEGVAVIMTDIRVRRGDADVLPVL